MKFYHIIRTFILLPILLLTIGCSVDTVEESDADILDPASTDFHFQNLPIIDGVGGSLIPLDEIPVVTIEKTREDDEFFYWQLKANPAPIHEDLVVGVKIQSGEAILWDVEVRTAFRGIVTGGIRLSPWIAETLSNQSDGRFSDDTRNSWDIVVVIPKLQNTSQEFKLLHSFGLKENETVTVFFPPPVAGEATGTLVEDVSRNISYRLSVMAPSTTAAVILKEGFVEIRDPLSGNPPIVFALLDMPVFQTFEGYIIREGFAFSYYMSGKASVEMRK